MAQKLLHLSFAFTALTTAQRRKLVSARKWIKVCHLHFFLQVCPISFLHFYMEETKTPSKNCTKMLLLQNNKSHLCAPQSFFSAWLSSYRVSNDYSF